MAVLRAMGQQGKASMIVDKPICVDAGCKLQGAEVSTLSKDSDQETANDAIISLAASMSSICTCCKGAHGSAPLSHLCLQCK